MAGKNVRIYVLPALIHESEFFWPAILSAGPEVRKWKEGTSGSLPKELDFPRFERKRREENLMPLFMGMGVGVNWNTAAAANMLPSLAGHLIFGAISGTHLCMASPRKLGATGSLRRLILASNLPISRAGRNRPAVGTSASGKWNEHPERFLGAP